MERIVIGLIDERSDRVALEWSARRATTRPSEIVLVTALDANASNPGSQKSFLAATAERIREIAPGTEVSTVLADGSPLPALLEQSESASLMVVPIHPQPELRDGRTPSLPISLAARSRCPVVIVPDDGPAPDGPIVVGIDMEPEPEPLAFAAREALESGRALRLVHSWQSWNALNARTAQLQHGEALKAAVSGVREQYPGITLTAELAEADPHIGLIRNSRDASLVVLGTHGIGRATGVVLGVIHLELLVAGTVPLCVVPVKDGS